MNLTALFRISRACFGTMRDSGGGSMIHIASDAGIRAVHEIAAYSVTKAGVIAVSELFGAEGAPYGIRSNAVCPGDIVPGVQATPAGHEDHAEDPAGWVLPPSGRFGTGEDVAGARRVARVRRVVAHDRGDITNRRRHGCGDARR